MIKKNSDKGAFLILFLISLLIGSIANILTLPAIIHQQNNVPAGLFGLFLLTSLWFAIGAFYREMSHDPEKET